MYKRQIIQRGGTILKTARSHEFETPEGRARAYQVIQENEIDGLVVIGGDGSLTGARLLANEHNLPIVGIQMCIRDSNRRATRGVYEEAVE